MKVLCKKDGHLFKKDPEDLDMLEFDIIQDLLPEIEYLETNPTAKIVLDYTEGKVPKLELVNCNSNFSKHFARVFNQSRIA